MPRGKPRQFDDPESASFKCERGIVQMAKAAAKRRGTSISKICREALRQLIETDLDRERTAVDHMDVTVIDDSKSVVVVGARDEEA